MTGTRIQRAILLMLATLAPLLEAGVARIDLLYASDKRVDAFGNAFRFTARIWDAVGSHGQQFAYDVL